jgi:Ca-activated chloride channel family protein
VRFCASDLAALEQAVWSLRPDGRTALYDAVMAGLDRLDEGSRSRKVLIVMSDGGDNASRATTDQVLERARRSDATIYTIGLFDTGDPDANPGVLKSLAQATGGERYLPRSASPLLLACTRIARDIRSGYTIAFEPSKRDGRYHRIRVNVDRTNGRRLTVRTRPGYFAPASPPVKP